MKKIFAINCQVKRAPKSIIPEGFSGAFVTCYSCSSDYEIAARAIIKKLRNDGLEVIGIESEINELAPGCWDSHIATQWPEHIDSLPSQTEFDAAMESGKVVYGPFGTFG